MFDGEITVSKTSLDLKFHTSTFTKDVATGHYLLHCENPAKKLALTLELTPMKPPTRQAHDGITKVGLKQETMFYYYIPRNGCTGSMTINGVTRQVEGEAWYDHEFGGEIKKSKRKGAPAAAAAASANGAAAMDVDITAGASSHEVDGDAVMAAAEDKDKKSYAWNWLSCQLSDGSDITATNLIEVVSGRTEDNFAILTGPAPKGERTEYLDMSLEAVKSWTSIRTTNDYPTVWRFRIPEAEIDLEVTSRFDNQEFITLISKPAFWEGRVDLKGTYKGQPITGKGFVERHGFQSMASLDHFFKRISKQVMEQIDMVMPLKPDYVQTRELMASAEFDHFMDGVSLEVFRQTIVQPLREIIDRGGKSWRSFAFLLCIDCVGGQSNKYKHWLAMPEMMHVGSLIVDDIQDKSEIRRGGPACHIVHGDPIAINVSRDYTSARTRTHACIECAG